MRKYFLSVALVLLLATAVWALTKNDNFSRADGALGANWNDLTDPWACQTTISSGVVRGIGSACLNAAIWISDSFADNQTSQVTIAQWDTPVQKLEVGAWVRGNTVNQQETGYFCRAVNDPGGDGSQIKIYKVINFSFTELTTPDTATWAATDTLKCGISESNITAYKNGGSILTATDGALASGGPGLSVDGGQSGDMSLVAIDDWIGTDSATTVVMHKPILQ